MPASTAVPRSVRLSSSPTHRPDDSTLSDPFYDPVQRQHDRIERRLGHPLLPVLLVVAGLLLLLFAGCQDASTQPSNGDSDPFPLSFEPANATLMVPPGQFDQQYIPADGDGFWALSYAGLSRLDAQGREVIFRPLDEHVRGLTTLPDGGLLALWTPAGDSWGVIRFDAGLQEQWRCAPEMTVHGAPQPFGEDGALVMLRESTSAGRVRMVRIQNGEVVDTLAVENARRMDIPPVGLEDGGVALLLSRVDPYGRFVRVLHPDGRVEDFSLPDCWYPTRLEESRDGDFVLLASLAEIGPPSRAQILCFDRSGSVLWQREIVTQTRSFWGMDVEWKDNGGVAVLAYDSVKRGGRALPRSLLLEFDSNLDVIGRRQVALDENRLYPRHLKPTRDQVQLICHLEAVDGRVQGDAVVVLPEPRQPNLP